jgi:hypothetical protein
VREHFAGALFNTPKDAKEEANLEYREVLLAELRRMAATYPADPSVRENWAKALLNTSADAEAEGNLKLSEGSLNELQALIRIFPGDPFLTGIIGPLLESSVTPRRRETEHGFG